MSRCTLGYDYGTMRIKLFFIPMAITAMSVLLLAAAGQPVRANDVPTILAMGDSLTAGYQLPPGAGFPAQLQKSMRARGIEVNVIDAGVSGDTSTGGRSRLSWSLEGTNSTPDLVIVEFGGNDALRGIEPSLTRANLDAILSQLADQNIPALLVGMRAPPNMGSEYEAEFNAIYPALAERRGVALYPFFLDGVALYPDLKLSDGLHPNEEGVAVMVERIMPYVERALKLTPSAPDQH